jgi:hypothetical protein
MPGSARWLMSHAVCHVVVSGLRLSKEQGCMRIGPDTCRHRTPTWVLIKDRCVLSWDLGTLLWAAWTPYGGVRIPFRGSGPYMWGS